ncbi:fatty-acid amide hydrolase 2 [Trichonephila clavata]|uniref:Fatty-acid amide hydrolase 2 n=1 Tax=Trichonephila clavata TaxID=2740835 RepID=A0A8X6G501_TRICU|nr:fatty-acid amide hydrolase 2 [Trichonephila clavata]
MKNSEVEIITGDVLCKKIDKGPRRFVLIRSSDVVKSYISRIQAVQPLINAYVDERFQEAFEEAKQVDALISSGARTQEEMERETPFLGVPFSAKEAVSVKGLFATGGAVFRKGAKAEGDCDVVRLFRAAGAIPLVVTNTSEMCLWWETYNKLHGKTKNPYDTTRTPGGSSGKFLIFSWFTIIIS